MLGWGLWVYGCGLVGPTDLSSSPSPQTDTVAATAKVANGPSENGDLAELPAPPEVAALVNGVS